MKRKLLIGAVAFLTACATMPFTACDFLFGDNTTPPYGDISGDDNAHIGAHTHEYTQKVVNPNCLTGGYTLNTCACGDNYKSDEKPALGHDYVNYLCSRCGSVDPDAPVSDGFVYSLNTDGQSYTVVKADNEIKELANVEIPDVHGGLNVTGIAKNVFNGFTKLETVKLPAGLKIIGQSAFYDCENLQSVTLPATLEEIHGKAFHNCKSLTEITIPASVISLGRYSGESYPTVAVFGGCEALTSLSVEDGNAVYTSKGNCVLSGGKVVQGCNASVIPDDGSVNEIGDEAFAYFRELTHIDIPSSVTLVAYGAFRNSGVEEIALPENLTYLAPMVFYGCDNLRAINTPEKITEIGTETFAFCHNLGYFDFSKVESVDYRAFIDCTALGRDVENPVNLQNLLYVHEYAFTNTGIFDASLQNAIEIAESAFAYCFNLSRVRFGFGLRNIGHFAFGECSCLSFVEFEEIPAWVSYPEDYRLTIGDKAFAPCPALRQIELPAHTVYIGSNAFENFAMNYEYELNELPEEQKPAIKLNNLDGWNLVFRKNSADDFGYYTLTDTSLISNAQNNAKYYMNKEHLLNKLKEQLNYEGIEYFDFDSFVLTKEVRNDLPSITK